MIRTIQATINHKPVSAPEGSTILQAARAAGIHIPVLCEHPALEIAGACRVCLVEIEGSPKLAAACSTPLAEGMKILTHSAKVMQTRRTIVELIVARHPANCTTCERNGRCELAKVCAETGVRRSPYSNPKERKKYPLDDGNPFIVRDRNKCILCGRCVRICSAHARYDAVDFKGRSSETMIDPSPEGLLHRSDCVFCGQCVQVCPSGALASKPASHVGRAWETRDVRTVCPYCGVGCELILKVDVLTGKIADVVSDHLSPTSFNRGRTCVKGRFAWNFVHSDERLTTPLVREGGVFRQASWDEALARVAEGLAKAKREKGPEAVGFLSSARCTNEENYLMQRLAREVMGTNNVDHCAHL